MIGFRAKRAIVDLMKVDAYNPASELHGVQISYSHPPTMTEKVIFGSDGIEPTESGVAEGVVNLGTAVTSYVIRVTGASGDYGATDGVAEVLADAVDRLIRANPAAVGPNTRSEVSGRQWLNPPDPDSAITELIVEITTRGYY